MATQPAYPWLVADIGATNARFGWLAAANAPIERIATLPCTDHPGLEAAIRAYLEGFGAPPPEAVAIGIATPVTGDRVSMTNRDWSFSIAELQAALGLRALAVVNDFTALALALPGLSDRDRMLVGGGQAIAGAAIALLGAGSGLGVSGLLPGATSGSWLPISGEGGHVTLAAEDDREAAVIGVLRRRYGHVSAERALSGPGLVDLYTALRQIESAANDTAELHGAAEVLARAAAGDRIAAATLDLFCGWLGQVAGNLALTLGARGGVYIGGGIVPRLGTAFAASPFRERFESKGRFRPYLAAIPVWVITASESPALAGAARALERQLAAGPGQDLASDA